MELTRLSVCTRYSNDCKLYATSHVVACIPRTVFTYTGVDRWDEIPTTGSSSWRRFRRATACIAVTTGRHSRKGFGQPPRTQRRRIGAAGAATFSGVANDAAGVVRQVLCRGKKEMVRVELGTIGVFRKRLALACELLTLGDEAGHLSKV